MFFKFILNKRLVYVFFILISLLVVHKALQERKKFDLKYSSSYDGVIYENQQIQRYLKFEGDFSFKNRVSQAIYEFKGNHVSGLYHAVILLLSPKLLINDYDIFIRSIVAVLAFCFSFYLIFRTRYYAIWVVSLLFLLFQLPIFYNIRIGLGSYTPEFVSAIYLLSGYLFLLYFFQVRQIRFFLLGITLLLLPIFFNVLFSLICSVTILPFIFVIIRKRVSFTRRQLVIMVLTIIVNCLFYSFYLIQHLSYYSLIFSSICYNNYVFSQFFHFLLDNFNNFYLGYFILFIILFFNINRLFRTPNHKSIITSKVNSLLLLYPIILFLIFLPIFKNNFPFLALLLLFWIFLLSLVDLQIIRWNKMNNYIQVKRLIILGLIIFIGLYLYL